MLQADQNHQPALVGLFLAVTDQFDQHGAGIFSRAHDLLPRLDGDYERAYNTRVFSARGGPTPFFTRPHPATFEWRTISCTRP